MTDIADKSCMLEGTVGGSTYVKPAQMDWKPTRFEKISIKVLYEDAEKGEMTCLLKSEPGAYVPFHKHPEVEQSFCWKARLRITMASRLLVTTFGASRVHSTTTGRRTVQCCLPCIENQTSTITRAGKPLASDCRVCRRGRVMRNAWRCSKRPAIPSLRATLFPISSKVADARRSDQTGTLCRERHTVRLVALATFACALARWSNQSDRRRHLSQDAGPSGIGQVHFWNRGVRENLHHSRRQEQAVATSGRLLTEYTEIESGKRNDRPKLAAAIKHAKVSGARLLIAKMDRLSRNAAFLLTLRDSGVRFVAADLPNADETVVGIMAVVAQNEREMIGRRTREALQVARQRLAREGRRLGNPNGAKCLREAHKGNRAATAEIVRAADGRAEDLRDVLADVLASGHQSYLAIAEELNRREIESPRGGKWYPASVARLRARLETLVNR